MIWKSGAKVIWRNRRFFGAAVVHIGLALMAYGVIFSAFYSYDTDQLATPNSTFVFDRYKLAVGNVEHEEGQNYTADFVQVDVYQNDELKFTLYPELREYRNQENIYGEVAYYSMPRGDLYVILQGYDLSQNVVRFTVIFQPLIIWIWVGCILMCLGAIYAATQNKAVPKVADE